MTSQHICGYHEVYNGIQPRTCGYNGLHGTWNYGQKKANTQLIRVCLKSRYLYIIIIVQYIPKMAMSGNDDSYIIGYWTVLGTIKLWAKPRSLFRTLRILWLASHRFHIATEFRCNVQEKQENKPSSQAGEPGDDRWWQYHWRRKS